jgi:hypothetical protein
MTASQTNRKAAVYTVVPSKTKTGYHVIVNADPQLSAAINRLRTELGELELRMLDRQIRMAWLWVISINAATLALAVAFLGALR